MASKPRQLHGYLMAARRLKRGVDVGTSSRLRYRQFCRYGNAVVRHIKSDWNAERALLNQGYFLFGRNWFIVEELGWSQRGLTARYVKVP